jgi:hypothetical protein
MDPKKRAIPAFEQKMDQPAHAAPRSVETDLSNYAEKSTRFDTTPEDRIAAHELFELFTATIIQGRTLFTR